MTTAWLALMLALAANAAQDNVRAIFEQANSDLLAGRFEEAAAGFDTVAARTPDEAPYLWQRGIALYYAGRYQDCREQFELHRTVNPADVENAVWHFMCVARLESPAGARNALLPVGRDPRSPMPEVYRMFRGELSPDDVLASMTEDLSSRFYGHLYVGLYHDALGDGDRALEHIRIAAEERFGAGYMPAVARVHLAYLEDEE